MTKHEHVEYIMLSKRKIQKRVKALAKALAKEYAGKTPLLVCILKGSTPFFADLIRGMEIPLHIDFMGVSSYGNGTTSGVLKVTKDLTSDIAGREVILVEDIIDSGNTLCRLKKLLSERAPANIKIITLLDKPARREADIAPDYTGFVIEDEFVIGYGLDYAEEYRNLPYVGVLKRSVYEE